MMHPARPVPLIASARCNGCGLCVLACPTRALTLTDGRARVARPDACDYLGACERICPTQAITRPFQILPLSSPTESSSDTRSKQMTPRFYSDWQTQARFSAAGPQPNVLVEGEHLKVIIGGLEAGQKIPQHPEAAAMYYFLEGTGWMSVDDQRFAVQPGAIVITPAGAKRGLEAETRLAFVASRAV
jgi:ferredoxin